MMFAAATIDEPRDKEDYQLWTGTDEHLICLSIYIYLHKLHTCSLPRLQVMPRDKKDDCRGQKHTRAQLFYQNRVVILRVFRTM
jgi:hypothetical protein